MGFKELNGDENHLAFRGGRRMGLLKTQKSQLNECIVYLLQRGKKLEADKKLMASGYNKKINDDKSKIVSMLLALKEDDQEQLAVEFGDGWENELIAVLEDSEED